MVFRLSYSTRLGRRETNLLHKLKHLFGKTSQRPIFVLGTGRSGTHWLGCALAAHPNIQTTVEAQPMFGLSTSMALDPELEPQLYPRLEAAYRWQLLKAAPRLYLDKNHPNIWLAERLLASFPDARFIGIERNPYATVASMMHHPGVTSWFGRWREFPVPNRFLGITEDVAPSYEGLPLATKCAMRWLSHHWRMRELQDRLADMMLMISYEAFALDTEKTTASIEGFLKLEVPLAVPEVKADSLTKWKQQLSPSELRQIDDVLIAITA